MQIVARLKRTDTGRYLTLRRTWSLAGGHYWPLSLAKLLRAWCRSLGVEVVLD